MCFYFINIIDGVNMIQFVRQWLDHQLCLGSLVRCAISGIIIAIGVQVSWFLSMTKKLPNF
jgi:hypothetical protein